MLPLKLYLLGPPRLEREGEGLELNTRKSMALLAYLAVTGQAHRREALTTLLWPNSRSRQARSILRTTLSVLNKTLAGQGLVVERERIGLDGAGAVWLDVAQFEQLTRSGQTHDHPDAEVCGDCLTQLAEAVTLYRSHFLEGFTLPDSAEFDDWQAFETGRLRHELAGVLEKLVRGHRDRGHFDPAISYAQRWLALDPLHEPAHRHLMALYAEAGHRSAALRQYQTCCELLEDELEVRPEAETTALYERIRQETAQQVRLIAETYGIVDGHTPEGLARNLVGQGGMGQVYRGIDTQSGEPMAIKLLKPEIVASNPELVERFVREGEALRQLNHPNIVKLLAAAEQEGQHYLVMEYVEGGSLHELIRRDSPLPLSRVLEIALDLADALTRAHRLGIIHRDLKPANVLLAADGTPRLTDFGTARTAGSEPLTETGLLVGTLNYLSPEGCDGHALDERADIWSFGVLLFELLTGSPPFNGETMTTILAAIMTQPTPDLTNYRGDIPPALADLVYRMLVKAREQRIPSVRLVGAELEAILADRPITPTPALAVPVGPPPDCPYRGLFAFLEEDAPFFFGRESVTDSLVEAVQSRGLVAVIGPSGSGKSSVVYAGLVARLREEPGWLIDDLRPGSDPFQGLAATLLPLLEPELSITAQLVEVRRLVESLRSGDLPLADVVDRILAQESEATRLLLVIDQFEELYTLCPEPEIRTGFMDTLFELIDLQQYQAGPTFTLVLTLRADFLEQALAHRPFADMIQDSDLKLGPMTREELGLAIERPAELQGVTFEGGLIERMLDDVGEEPGNLPLLEFALTALWERLAEPPSRQLTHAGYEASGGVEGALTRHAETVYAKLSPAQQETARNLFTQLVRPGERTEDTRRLALRSELQPADWQLAQRLADARLVVTGRDAAGQETVEVAHESLIRTWERLSHWLDADREFLFWQQRLRSGLRQWQASDQDEGALLRGAPLAEAENWLNQRRTDLNEAEREYIQAGLALRERQAAEREAQRRRELEVAQELAESEKQRAEEQARAAGSLRKRAVWLAGVGVVAVLLAVAAGMFGVQSSQNAEQANQAQQTAEARRRQAETAQAEAVTAQQQTEREARRAKASQLATQAQLLLESGEDPSGTLPLLLAREAILTTLTEDGYFTAEADAALRRVVDSVPVLLQTFSGHTDGVLVADFSPDGKTLATGSADQTVRLWDVDTGQERHRLQGHTLDVWSIDFSPDGKTLVSASPDRTIRLWDVATGAEVRRFEGHTGTVLWAIFSPDGKTIASAGSWTNRFSGVTGVIRESIDRLNFDETIRLWDVTSGNEIQRFAIRVSNREGGGGYGAYSPDGKTIVTSGEDRTARLWDVATGAEIRRFDGHMAAVAGAVFSPDGQTIVTTSDDHTLRLWDVATGEEIRRFEGHTGAVLTANFSSNGQTIISAGLFSPQRHDRIVRLWDVATGAETYQLADQKVRFTFATFSLDGRSIITTSPSPDNAARLWAASPKGKTRRLEGHLNPVKSVDFSPDGQTIATASEDKTIRLWDAANGEEIAWFKGHTGRVNAVAFSPDGQILASAGFDKVVRLWDANTGKPVGQFEGHNGTILSLAFSPDGQMLVTGAEDKTVRLWDVTTGWEIQRFEGHTSSVNAVAFRSDNQTLVTGGADKMVRVWDVETGEEIRRLEGHTLFVRAVDFSPDGQTIVSAGTDNAIRLWDVDLGREIGQLEAHKALLNARASVNAVVFSPDGQFIVTTGNDGSVLVWDVETRSVLRRLDGHTDRVYSAAFSPDGQTIVTASRDKTARIWPSVEQLLAEAEALIQRDPPEFTPGERTRFGLGDE